MQEIMIKTSSDNYDFYYFKNSVAARDIDKIIKLQESCYKQICDKLLIQSSIRIQYYLLDSPELVGKVYGDNESCNGFAAEPDKIYAVYSDKVKCVGYHEDTHILSYTINIPQSTFLREGLAMYFDGLWWDKPNQEWVKLYIKEGKYIPIVDLFNDNIFNQYGCEITYPIAGAFTKFIIDKFKIEHYLEFYRYSGIDFRTNFKRVYSQSLANI